MEAFVFATFIALMVVLVIFGARYSAARQRALAQELEQHGFSRVERNLAKAATKPFRRLFNGYVTGVFARPSDQGEEILAYVVQQMGKHSYPYTLFARRLPSELPSFRLRPEGVMDKVAAFAGFDDIDFDDAPEFSAAIHLSGESPDAVRDLFTQDVCLALAAQKRLRISSANGWLVVHDWRQHPHTRIVDFLSWATSAADLFA